MTEIPPTSPLLLSCIQELILIERTLTETLEERKRRRSRPTPISMSQVEGILALARTYSSRTSAPPGWRPSNLVINFATPNPTPDRLRGGSLAALELQLERKRRREKREDEIQRELQRKQRSRRKKNDGTEDHHQQQRQNQQGGSGERNAMATGHNATVAKSSGIDMNLSDSSSSEEDDSDDDDDDEDSMID